MLQRHYFGTATATAKEYPSFQEYSKTNTPVIKKYPKFEYSKPAITVSAPAKKPSTVQSKKYITEIAMPFIKKFEGTIKDKDGFHVLYDDVATAVNKNYWNGKGGNSGIKQFIDSCKGQPTIGYGETNTAALMKGKISDAEADRFLLETLTSLDNYLTKKYKYYSSMNENQRSALLSFTYNLRKKLY